MTSIGNHKTILSNRTLFNSVVYTPLSEALTAIEERQKDAGLIKKVDTILKGNIPEILTHSYRNAVLFRQIATPNYEGRYFQTVAKEYNLKPIFFEYHDDKFTSNNEFKHSLGQLRIQGLVNKNDSYPIEKISVVDFNTYNGKPLRDVKTLWGESLIDFHRNLFIAEGYDINDFYFYDASTWFKSNGNKAIDYYTNYLLLFVCHGILFENFLLDDSEIEFTKNVVLPAIENVMTLTGLKPLIVPGGPMDMESDKHWISYDLKIKPLVTSHTL